MAVTVIGSASWSGVCALSDDRVDELIRDLGSARSLTRASAASRLGELGEKAKNAVESLIRSLDKEEDPNVRVAIVSAFGLIGREARSAVPVLLRALDDQDTMMRVRAARALTSIEDPAAIPALIKAMEMDRHLLVRRAAAAGLGAFGPAAKEAVPVLIRALKDPDRLPESFYEQFGDVPATLGLYLSARGVADWAELALQAIGADAVPAIAKLLRDTDREHRLRAIRLLGSMEEHGKAAVPNLISLLSSDDIQTRGEAIAALGNIGPGAKAALPALTAALKGRLSEEQISAALALKQIDQGNVDAVPHIVVALRDPRFEVRREALRALRALAELKLLGRDLPVVVSAFSRALNDHEEGIRYGAILGLDYVGEAAQAATPALLRTLKDPSVPTRVRAASTLSVVRDGDVAVAGLTEALGDEEEEVRANAAVALGAHGPKAKAAVPALKKALKDEHESVREAASHALRKIEGRH